MTKKKPRQKSSKKTKKKAKITKLKTPKIHTEQSFSLLDGIDRKTGIVTQKYHELMGKSVANSELRFQKSTGSTVGVSTLLELKENNVAPSKIILGEPDSNVIAGCILAGIDIEVEGVKAVEYPKRIRMITFYHKDSKKVFRFITNNFEMSAEEIADIYKGRWQIELFFKWIKQHLNIKSFYSTSENGVKIQIWCALITYLLLILK